MEGPTNVISRGAHRVQARVQSVAVRYCTWTTGKEYSLTSSCISAAPLRLAATYICEGGVGKE